MQVWGWMLIVKKTAGVAREVSLGNLFNAGKRIHPGFETQGKRHKKSKNRDISGSTKRTYAPEISLEKIFFFEIELQSLSTIHQPSWFEPMHCLHRSPTQMKAIVRLLKSSHVYAPLPSVKCAQFNEDVSFKGRSRLSANKYLSRKTWKGKVNTRRVKSSIRNMTSESSFPVIYWQCWHFYLD